MFHKIECRQSCFIYICASLCQIGFGQDLDIDSQARVQKKATLMPRGSNQKQYVPLWVGVVVGVGVTHEQVQPCRHYVRLITYLSLWRLLDWTHSISLQNIPSSCQSSEPHQGDENSTETVCNNKVTFGDIVRIRNKRILCLIFASFSFELQINRFLTMTLLSISRK